MTKVLTQFFLKQYLTRIHTHILLLLSLLIVHLMIVYPQLMSNWLLVHLDARP